MKKLLKLILLLMMVGLVAGAVAAYVSRKKFQAMSDEEIRDFLAGKLEGKVAADQLASIQEAVIAGVRTGNGTKSDLSATDIEDAVDDIVESARGSVDDAAEVIEAVNEESV